MARSSCRRASPRRRPDRLSSRKGSTSPPRAPERLGPLRRSAHDRRGPACARHGHARQHRPRGPHADRAARRTTPRLDRLDRLAANLRGTAAQPAERSDEELAAMTVGREDPHYQALAQDLAAITQLTEQGGLSQFARIQQQLIGGLERLSELPAELTADRQPGPAAHGHRPARHRHAGIRRRRDRARLRPAAPRRGRTHALKRAHRTQRRSGPARHRARQAHERQPQLANGLGELTTATCGSRRIRQTQQRQCPARRRIRQAKQRQPQLASGSASSRPATRSSQGALRR